MNWVKAIINACTAIMTTSVDLFGYHVNLLQVVIYGFMVFILFFFICRISN